MGLNSQGHGITKTIYVSKQAHAFIKVQPTTKQNRGKWSVTLT
jgi:hypothetical protein